MVPVGSRKDASSFDAKLTVFEVTNLLCLPSTHLPRKLRKLDRTGLPRVAERFKEQSSRILRNGCKLTLVVEKRMRRRRWWREERWSRVGRTGACKPGTTDATGGRLTWMAPGDTRLLVGDSNVTVATGNSRHYQPPPPEGAPSPQKEFQSSIHRVLLRQYPAPPPFSYLVLGILFHLLPSIPSFFASSASYFPLLLALLVLFLPRVLSSSSSTSSSSLFVRPQISPFSSPLWHLFPSSSSPLSDTTPADENGAGGRFHPEKKRAKGVVVEDGRKRERKQDALNNPRVICAPPAHLLRLLLRLLPFHVAGVSRSIFFGSLAILFFYLLSDPLTLHRGFIRIPEYSIVRKQESLNI